MKTSQGQPRSNYEFYKTQFVATIICSLSSLSLGAMMGYTSPAMGEIQHIYSLSEQEVSMVTSIIMLGAIFGCFAGGAVSNRFGRKDALILMASICVLGWVVLLCTQHVSMLYIGRFISGFAAAVCSTTAPVYITEIASPEIRGALGSCYVLFSGIGVFYVNLLGAFLSWRYLIVACMAIPTVQIVLLMLLPETPIWLLRNNCNSDVVADALKWLKRSDKLADQSRSSNFDAQTVTLKCLLKPALLKPFVLIGMLLLITQFSGIGVVVVYAVSIFASATDAVDPNLSAILISASLVASHLATFTLVDRLGRRLLLLLSSVFMSIGMIPLGAYYYLKDHDPESVANVVWLPMTSLVVFTLSYGIGFGPVPWVMLGEVFPNKARGLASTLLVAFHYVACLIVSKTFVDMQATMHDYGVFLFYSSVSVFGVFFTYLFVPETKGLTITEIEDYFAGRRKCGLQSTVVA